MAADDKVRTGSSRSRPRDDHESVVVRPPCQLDVRAVIAEKAVLIGTHEITVGANSVIHPNVKLDSTAGSITIGQNCIVSERATILGEVVIEDNVTVETRATVEASYIGVGSVVGTCATLRQASKLGSYCKIGPAEQLESGTDLPDYTVMHSEGQKRLNSTLRDHQEVQQARLKHQEMHIAVLRQLIPSNIAKWQT